MSVDPTIHVRIKQRNQTFFIYTARSKTIATLKEEICRALGKEGAPRKMRIYHSKTSTNPLPDSAALSDHESIQNDSLLYLVFRKPGKENEEEDVYDDANDFWESIS